MYLLPVEDDLPTSYIHQDNIRSRTLRKVLGTEQKKAESLLIATKHRPPPQTFCLCCLNPEVPIMSQALVQVANR